MRFNQFLSVLLPACLFIIQDASVIGQNQPVATANYRMAERFSPTKIDRMVFSTRVTPSWMKTGNKFWYYYKKSDGTFYYIVDLDKQSKSFLFDNHEMARQLTLITKDPYDHQNLPDIDPEFIRDDRFFRFKVTSTQMVDVEVEEEEKKKPKSWASVSPDSTYVVFARDYNLFWIDKENYMKVLEDEQDTTIVEHRLTSEGEQYYAFGGGYTAQMNDDKKKIEEEKNKRRRANIIWSPDSRRFAVIRNDTRNIKFMWVINSLSDSRPELESYKYQMPGEEDPAESELWVFDMEAQKGDTLPVHAFKNQTVNVPRMPRSHKENLEDHTPAIWLSPSSDELYFTRISRDLKRYDVCRVDLKTKEVTVLIEERMNTYVDTRPPYLFRINLNGSGLRLLNPGNYNHQAVVSDSYRYFVNNYSRVNTTPRSEVRNARGELVMELETADLSNLVNAGYQFPEPYTVKAADGVTDLYGVMYKPFDFDPAKSYPLIMYVYPGPQTEAVNTSFSHRMDRTDRLAQLGFIVVTLGNRGGHPNQSKWYHNYGYGDLRDYGLDDKKYGAEQLADRHAFIDIDHVGIFGHSGGGFMSTAAMLQYPDFFKVAVSSAGNHENNIYNRWWSEKHHGIKEIVNNEGEVKFVYDIETNSEIARNLRGKLLLTTGDMDNNVHPANTFRMADALIKAKKRFDMFIFTGQRHGYGDHTEYNFWLTADYFAKHLIGDYSISTDIFEMRREHKMLPSERKSD